MLNCFLPQTPTTDLLDDVGLDEVVRYALARIERHSEAGGDDPAAWVALA